MYIICISQPFICILFVLTIRPFTTFQQSVHHNLSYVYYLSIRPSQPFITTFHMYIICFNNPSITTFHMYIICFNNISYVCFNNYFICILFVLTIRPSQPFKPFNQSVHHNLSYVYYLF